MVSDNCFDTTGEASAGLPGLTMGEQMGGMWKSIAEIIQINTSEFNRICGRDQTINTHKLHKAGDSQPKEPSSGDSKEGVITSILIAVNIV